MKVRMHARRLIRLSESSVEHNALLSNPDLCRRLGRRSSSALAAIPRTATATPHLYSREVFRVNGPMYVDPLLEVAERLERAADRYALYWRLNPDRSVTQVSGEEWINDGAERERALRNGEPDPWRVALDELGGPCYVSTVFIGLNTIGPREAPIVFETMARIGRRGEDEITRKYSTFEAALAGHRELVDEHNGGGDAGRG